MAVCDNTHTHTHIPHTQTGDAFFLACEDFGGRFGSVPSGSVFSSVIGFHTVYTH